MLGDLVEFMLAAALLSFFFDLGWAVWRAPRWMVLAYRYGRQFFGGAR